MRQAKVDNVEKSKDKTFISRMVRTLAKLESKYLTTKHKKKRLLFTRNQKTGLIIPKERASICNVLAAPEPEKLTVLKKLFLRSHGTIGDLNLLSPPQSHVQAFPAPHTKTSTWTGIAPQFIATTTQMNLNLFLQTW